MRALPFAGRVLAGQESLLAGVEQDDERARLRVVGREALVDRERRVLELDRLEVADRDRRTEAAGQVRPGEGERAGGDLEEPQPDPRAERHAHELAARQALDLLLAQRLDRLLGQGGGLSIGSTW